MLAAPGNWAKYYQGTDARAADEAAFLASATGSGTTGPSLRRRKGWSGCWRPSASGQIPLPLISQYLGHLEPEVSAGRVRPTAPALLQASVTRVLEVYASATD